MMPPLPALRYSPRREHRTENCHKRGRSFESGLNLKPKDDDLVLFNEVQSQEKDNFLLHTTDDFEDSISKLKLYSDFKIGIDISSRGTSSDLLNEEDEKNDYEWLLTPPDTPLFSTLDDDDPQVINLASSGRPRSKPIPISTSLTDKNYQTSQVSYSLQRLSPSPRSNAASTQMKGRSFSAPRSSHPPIVRSTTPTQRSCTPPNKPSTSAPRSSTPTLRRASTSSSIHVSKNGGRGASPVKASRGNYVSPKLQGRQMTLYGFDSGAPPNLRSSLSDRPVSHVRGSSPSSRNGRELSMKLAGRFMSPSSSRCINSSHCQERDQSSSYSKGSMAYSVDDEESMPSITAGVSRSIPPRKDGVLANNSAMLVSRKSSRASPSNSVPKRSFDSSLRLMDQCKTPPSMFRPLLSSVPPTTFRPIFSRNSSLTTSSNTSSSEQGIISVALDAQNDLPGGWEMAEAFDSREEIFLFDKADQIIRDTYDEALSRMPQAHDEDFSEILRKKFNSKDTQNPIRSIGDVASSKNSFDFAHCGDNQCDIDGSPIKAACSKCGKEFKSGNNQFCKKCGENRNFTAEIALTSVVFTENEVPSQRDTVMEAMSKEGQLNSGPSELHVADDRGMKFHQRGRNLEPGDNLIQNVFSKQLLDQNKSQISDQQLEIKNNINVNQEFGDNAYQSLNHVLNRSLKVDVPELAGISVLLQQGSASTKCSILQGKCFSATNIFCSEPSYSRNNAIASRRSFGLDSSSATSSIDLGLSGQRETYVPYELNRKREPLGAERDIEGCALDFDASTNCNDPRLFGNKFEEKISSSTVCSGLDSAREMILDTEEYTSSLDKSNLNSWPSSSRVILEDYRSVHDDSCRKVSSSELQNLNHQGNNDLPCSSEVDFMHAEECPQSLNTDEDPQNSRNNVQIVERTSDSHVFSGMEDHILVNHYFHNVISDAATNSCSIGATESDDGYIGLEEGQIECMPFHKPPSPERSNEHTILQSSENDIFHSSSEFSTAILENESNIVVEVPPRGNRSRSLTLEEATDTILFCSSIIHDLAYKASTIAMEEGQDALPEPYFPPKITIMEKPIPGLREQSGNLSNKLTPRSQKLKRKKTESHINKSPLREFKNVNDAFVEEFTASIDEIPKNVDSTKPPKLESKCNCAVM